MSDHRRIRTPRRDTLARPRLFLSLSAHVHPLGDIRGIRLKIHRAGRGDVLARLLVTTSRETPLVKRARVPPSAARRPGTDLEHNENRHNKNDEKRYTRRTNSLLFIWVEFIGLYAGRDVSVVCKIRE